MKPNFYDKDEKLREILTKENIIPHPVKRSRDITRRCLHRPLHTYTQTRSRV